ncbi:MAG: hypothetical protein H6760_01475 [Candidatus Nomurabacteria bacterium]|nr:MAG: hypothetical protein H6760_01475 [Candidatus Nomurabacteria bacterium]
MASKQNKKKKEEPVAPLQYHQRNRLIGIYAFAILAWAGFWWLIRTAFAAEMLLSAETLWLVSGAFVLFGLSLGLFGLMAAVVRIPRWGVLYAAGAGLLPIAFFPLNLFTLAGALLLMAVWFRYWAMVTEESEHRIRFNLVKSVTHGLGTIIYLTVLSVAVFYLAVTSQSNQTSTTFIDNVTNSASDAVLAVLDNQLPEFDAQMTLDAFITQYSDQDITALLPENFLPEDVNKSLLEENTQQNIENLDETARQAAIEEARTQLLQALNIHAEGSDSMETVVRRLVEDKLQPLLERYDTVIPPVLALALFSVLSILGLVYFWWIVLWAFICYGILRILRWVEFVEHTQTVTRAEIKN